MLFAWPAAAGLAAPSVIHAQGDTTAVASSRYARHAAHRFLFGSGYRDLWGTPIRVPVLDLRTYAGGLRPLSAGGGFQTLSLWFRGADGYMYAFRSVDKLPGVLPVEVESTFVKDVVQDQTSASHPGAPAVVAPLLEAAGVLHTDPVLVLLPDDASLDTFRMRFGGVLGFLERRAIVEPERPGFAGALEIISTRRLLPRIRRSPDDRIDARALLTARLMDVFLGDWDRHRGQWTWARLSAEPPALWQPIPEDRDQAFSRFDGMLLGAARSTSAPFLVEFGPKYASTFGQTWNGRDLDRWFLGALDRAAWDSIAAALQAHLTDSVLVVAVRRLPDAWYARDGERLTRALQRRRDALPAEAARYYRQLAREAEVHGTAADEDIGVERLAQGRLAVRVARRGDAAPWFSRTYQPGETKEVRIFTRGGADRVLVGGDGPNRITLRVIADSQVVVADSSRAGGVKRYDAAWRPVALRRPLRISGLPQRPGAAQEEHIPPHDWGARVQPVTWVSYGPDVGVFLGLGLTRTQYGFRESPWGSRWNVRGGWATGASEGRLSVDGIIRRPQSLPRTEVGGHASGIEVLRWNGTGNATTLTQPESYYRVSQAEIETHARLVVPLRRVLELRGGLSVKYNHTRPQPGRIIEDSLPYGSGNFGQAGVQLGLDAAGECCWQHRVQRTIEGDSVGLDSAFIGVRGLRLTVGGSAYPRVWSVTSAFGEVHGEATAYAAASGLPGRPTLALRGGGKRVFGTYPFMEAAFIGDARTARLGRQNRYAGDAAAWGNAELRLTLTRFFVLLPGDIGVLGLADAGRVFVSGEQSEQWHSAVGGGVWISLLQPANLLSVSVAKSRERTAVYFGAGFTY